MDEAKIRGSINVVLPKETEDYMNGASTKRDNLKENGSRTNKYTQNQEKRADML